MASEGKGVLVKADPIANTFREEIKSALAAAPRPPKLVGILATAAAPSRFYAEFTKKQCDALGVEFVLRTVGAAADETLAPGEGVEEAIIEANEDDGVDGIMVCLLCVELVRGRIVYLLLRMFVYARSTIPFLACNKYVCVPRLYEHVTECVNVSGYRITTCSRSSSPATVPGHSSLTGLPCVDRLSVQGR